MKPTAGTVSGVHPVPLGFGRVYVKIDGEFSYESWLKGLQDGRSFVTTGPMLDVDFEWNGKGVIVSGRYETANLERGTVEIVVNGEESPIPLSENSKFEVELPLGYSSWFAVRVIEGGRPRFAHTAPKHFKVHGKPLRPKAEEVAYLIKRVQNEIDRHTDVLEKSAMDEYRMALDYYKSLLQ